MGEFVLDNATDLVTIRIEQARLLKERAIGSAIIVEIFILLFTGLIWGVSGSRTALIWLLSASCMALITVLYAKYKAPNGIAAETVDSYLLGHIIICGLTGAVWGGYAIYILDFGSPASFFIAGSMPTILTVGGMLPSSAYRPGYVALASLALLSFGFYLIITAPGSLRFFGVGTLTYFGLAMISSTQAELNTRDGIIARTRKNLTEKVIEQNEIIQRAHDDKTRFLAATSHDMSQPLHAQGYFIQALRRAITTQDQNDLLDKIEGSWRAQNKLLEGLVDITRLDSGVISPNIQPVNLKDEIENIMQEFEAIAKTNAITLQSNLETMTVNTDSALLSRVLKNILSNAVKFTPSGGKITLNLTRKNNAAKITISDTGIGIPQLEHQNIFKEYVQLNNDNRDREKGLGLGLSIVNRLTQLLAIELNFTSNVGKGTQFELSLPLDHKSEIASPDPTKRLEKINAAPLIILIDDEIAIREGMTTLMTGWGCQVITAASGDEAIALLSETNETPSLLIIDKRLAGKENGIEVIERLREEVNETIPAILITGDLKGFKGLTPDSDIQLMTKPVEPYHIKQAIKAVDKR